MNVVARRRAQKYRRTRKIIPTVHSVYRRSPD
jgi:hypothetical protein